jgi:hypothetical protein
VKFKKETKRALQGLYLGCFGINIFSFLMVMEAWGSGHVPIYLPFMLLGTAVLCLVGWGMNTPRPGDDDEVE